MEDGFDWSDAEGFLGSVLLNPEDLAGLTVRRRRDWEDEEEWDDEEEEAWGGEDGDSVNWGEEHGEDMWDDGDHDREE